MLFGPLVLSKLAQVCSRLAHVALLERILSQVGSNLAQVGPKLDPSWFQVGFSWAQVEPKTAGRGSWERPGGHQEPRGTPGGPKGAKMASNSLHKYQKLISKTLKIDSKLIQNPQKNTTVSSWAAARQLPPQAIAKQLPPQAIAKQFPKALKIVHFFSLLPFPY